MYPNPVTNPDAEWPAHDDSDQLGPDDLKLYQSVTALINFSSLDRPDLMFSVKELMRRMAVATENDLGKLKRVVKFIRTLPRVVAQYKWKPLPDWIEIYTDSDHAGCPPHS